MLFNFGWFIHTSPEVNIESIRKEGLKPNRDATILEDLKGLVARDNICASIRPERKNVLQECATRCRIIPVTT